MEQLKFIARLLNADLLNLDLTVKLIQQVHDSVNIVKLSTRELTLYLNIYYSSAIEDHVIRVQRKLATATDLSSVMSGFEPTSKY